MEAVDVVVGQPVVDVITGAVEQRQVPRALPRLNVPGAGRGSLPFATSPVVTGVSYTNVDFSHIQACWAEMTTSTNWAAVLVAHTSAAARGTGAAAGTALSARALATTGESAFAGAAAAGALEPDDAATT